MRPFAALAILKPSMDAVVPSTTLLIGATLIIRIGNTKPWKVETDERKAMLSSCVLSG